MKFLTGFFIATLLVIAPAAAEETEPKIREFPIPTIEALGRELYERDLMAATAFDVLMEEQPDLAKMSISGWITELGKEPKVYILQEKDGQRTLAYVVKFAEGEKPRVVAHLGEPLPEAIAKRDQARVTAVKAIPRFMTKRYNFEVLDDPDGEGFLVYALAATTKSDEIIVGGHYRVTVSADATKAEQVDALSRSFLVLPKQPKDLPEGAELAAYFMSHIVSPTPVETHVLLTLMHHCTFAVATSEKDIWNIKEGAITKTDADKFQNP